MAQNITEIPTTYIDAASERATRKRARAPYTPDPRVEQMRRLLTEDPASFDRTFGPRGRIILGHDDAARAAANPEEAA